MFGIRLDSLSGAGAIRQTQPCLHPRGGSENGLNQTRRPLVCTAPSFWTLGCLHR